MDNIFFDEEENEYQENNNKTSAINVAEPLGNTITKGSATFFNKYTLIEILISYTY